jgi:FkbM family methyltransferase
MNLETYERLQPNTIVDGILFNLPNRHCEWRVQTIYTKEPDTIAWIRSLPAGEVFYDVGANIGLYTLVAAQRGLSVFAFEPEAQNFALLIRNLAMNSFAKDTVVAFPLCISDGQFVDTLRLSSLMPGGSCHSFASDLNYKMQKKEWAYKQGSMGMSLDALVFEIGLPQPDHIKVDVDGFENKVIYGAARTMERVKSILVELDSGNSEHMEIKARLEGLGFLTDPVQIDAARRKEGAFVGIGNIIFTRPPGEEHGRKALPEVGEIPTELHSHVE